MPSSTPPAKGKKIYAKALGDYTIADPNSYLPLRVALYAGEYLGEYVGDALSKFGYSYIIIKTPEGYSRAILSEKASLTGKS